MPIKSFSVGPLKALRLASCASVPKLMIIAGPNGVGKSTLLFGIKQGAGKVQQTGKVLYLSPHRIWRRQSIQMTQLWEAPRSFQDILESSSFGGFGGLRILEGNRTPDSADESFSAVKYTLSQFETRKQNAVNLLLEQNGKVTRDEVGDIYQPIREFARVLLPHLIFERIDLSARENVRVVFKRTDQRGSTFVELDDLSSGERALISMFMPFLEEQISLRLSQLLKHEDGKVAARSKDLSVLIDEPEIHLHPFLQARLIEYLRQVTADGTTQFILATHSPTMLDAADFDEIFVLNPPSEVEGQNQLVPLATSADRLAAMRLLTGSTFNLTVGRKLLCIEGEFPSRDSNRATDVRLLELMCPELLSYVLLPFGGKSNTIDAAKRLRELLPAAFGVESVQALVDRDSSPNGTNDWVHQMPGAMIENLLLEPEPIWSILAPHRERLTLANSADVKQSLLAIARARRTEEIRIRVKRELPIVRLNAEGTTVDEVLNSWTHQTESSVRLLPNREELSKIVGTATDRVDEILAAGEELSLFHGKEILRRFHSDHVHALGIGYDAFCLQLARAIGISEAARKRIAESLSKLIQLQLEDAAESLSIVTNPT